MNFKSLFLLPLMYCFFLSVHMSDFGEVADSEIFVDIATWFPHWVVSTISTHQKLCVSVVLNKVLFDAVHEPSSAIHIIKWIYSKIVLRDMRIPAWIESGLFLFIEFNSGRILLIYYSTVHIWSLEFYNLTHLFVEKLTKLGLETNGNIYVTLLNFPLVLSLLTYPSLSFPRVHILYMIRLN